MSFKIDIDPLEALEIFYKGEKLGAWEGDFIKNEKKTCFEITEAIEGFFSELWTIKCKLGYEPALVAG